MWNLSFRKETKNMGWLHKEDRNLTDYERFKKLSADETMQNRDVYNGQQPGRTHFGEKQSPTSRHLFAAALTILVMFIIWIFISMLTFVTDGGFLGTSLVDPASLGFGNYVMQFTFGKFVGTISLGFLFFLVMDVLLMKNKEAQDALNTTEDINQYPNDQHIAYPEEIQEKFDYFPDVGATSDVQFSSMISHMALSNKGLKTVTVAKLAEKDILDEDGEVLVYKGEIIRDEDGNSETEEKPLIDEGFMDALFEASGLPKDPRRKMFRIFYDTRKIKYNPGNKNRDKLQNKEKPYDTVADLINADWQLPYYEPQRPGGAYIVDTAPVNTMVLAITRAGKGQTYIEPVLDMWTRERRPNNMVINDPKGELLVKYYVRGTVRGFQIIQFNLINAMKTDIYNPLCLAADAAREGDFTKAALYVENIADVFFPLDGGEDPVWPNAANNAFKRSAYGMIDYYLEEERELRARALRTNMDEKILETKLDEMWGKVTLYNTYQLFVQLTSKKRPNPAVQFQKDAKNRKFDNLPDDEYTALCEEVKLESKIWEDNPEADELTLFFNATAMLPTNSMRRLVMNADNALKSMGAAEKMLASVYGIAITAMSFFTDPTISTLTSGTPSQNADLPGLSFPRCFGIRFHSEYLKKYHLIGMQCRWSSYKDKDFTMDMGKDFYHEDMISREGWAKYYFKGKYDRDYAYVQCRIVNPQTGQYIHTYRFQFRKSYQTSLDARYYVTDPILGDKIVKNGVLIELQPRKTREGKIVYRRGKTTFKQEKIEDVLTSKHRAWVDTNAIIQTSVRYSEKPKMIFLVTPPHLIPEIDKCQFACYNEFNTR
jgi:hypothetical protein